jgi:hypothetical protein
VKQKLSMTSVADTLQPRGAVAYFEVLTPALNRGEEEVMREKPHPDRRHSSEPHVPPSVVQMQDVARAPAPDTRMSNKGVKIPPTPDSNNADRKEEDAIAALKQLEDSIKGGPYN